MKTEILLAAYNGEAFLQEQLDSLAAQSFSDFIIRYQDDGSADRTPDILKDYAARDSRMIPGTEGGRHLGAKGNFFSLLRQAEGDRIFLCDQDDIWEPEKVQRLLFAMEKADREDPGLPILIHSDASVVDKDGRQLAPGFFRLQGWDPEATGLNRLLVQNNATGCMMLLNRPLADLVIHYGNPEKMFMHDWFIAMTAAAFGKVVFIPEALTRYRQHGNNAIGASRDSLPVRALKALGEREKSKARIALTYEHSQAFLDTYSGVLPEGAERIIINYLLTRNLPKLRRVSAIRKQGCLMQSPVTRAGQFLFG